MAADHAWSGTLHVVSAAIFAYHPFPESFAHADRHRRPDEVVREDLDARHFWDYCADLDGVESLCVVATEMCVGHMLKVDGLLRIAAVELKPGLAVSRLLPCGHRVEGIYLPGEAHDPCPHGCRPRNLVEI
jgi:hypothetical protein